MSLAARCSIWFSLSAVLFGKTFAFCRSLKFESSGRFDQKWNSALSAANGDVGDKNARIVIVGVAGGVVETVAVKLAQKKQNNLKLCLVLDRPPYSPLLNKDSNVNIFVGDEESSFDKLTQLSRDSSSSKYVSTYLSDLLQYSKGDKLIIAAIGDQGDESLLTSAQDLEDISKGDIVSRVGKAFNRIYDSLKKAVTVSDADISIVCAASVDPDTGVGLSKGSSNFGIGSILKSPATLSAPINALRSFYTSSCGNGAAFGLLRYGTLTGGVPGAEPLPFISMPLLEPELHPSYVLNSVLMTSIQATEDGKAASSMKYAASEFCTRDSLAESIVQFLIRTSQLKKATQVELDSFIQSIEGPSSPSQEDWDKIFSRLMSSSSKAADVELLRLDFETVPKEKLQQFSSWLVDTWFPQALIEADAATILSGARPVRAVKVGSSDNSVDINISWQDLLPDLTVKAVGTIQISVSSEPPSITARRVTGGGELPGENQLLERLEEGIYKNAFKKQFCSPLKRVAEDA
mmetsp:Transcript_5529/g.8205  ORF Transcript_5529/g.8205 Transcript_5529/m.8205 type:complete len:519 (-) Transcript_5529:948-2504(-)